jgi:nuclear cap-binding protein subunit 1
VLNLFRGRATASDVTTHLDSLRNSLETSEEGINIDAAVRSITVQSLLNIGSRSFSHLLNAIERYLPLLRSIASASGGIGSDADAKAGILDAAAVFWKRNRQMVAIVFDKLMQYQIVDPSDVVGWTFVNGALIEARGPQSMSAFEWDLLKGALDKANGRVMIARRKVVTLRKEEDDTRARAKASEDTSMDVDQDTKQGKSSRSGHTHSHSCTLTEDSPVVDNPVLTTALKAFTSLTREQKGALSRTLDGFVSCLVPEPFSANSPSRKVLSEQAWQDRGSWGRDEWNAWETWGWYRHFCGSVRRSRNFWGHVKVLNVPFCSHSILRTCGTTPSRSPPCPLRS